MARKKVNWDKVKALYESGLPLSEIEKRTGVNRGSISRKAKMQQWQHGKNADYIVAKEVLTQKKATLNPTELHYLDDVADEYIRNKKIINDLSLQAMQKVKETLEDGKVEEIATVSGEMGEIRVVERKLNPREIKSLVDAIDKAGQTLGVVPRFSQQVNIQNNQVVENKTLQVRFIDADTSE